MAAGFLAMSVRFITTIEKKKARLGRRPRRVVLGLFFGFDPLVQLLTGGGTVSRAGPHRGPGSSSSPSLRWRPGR